MKKVLILLVFALFGVWLLSGCASIVSKSDYPVNISSQPPGAKISITNSTGRTIYTGQTPTTVNLKANAGYFKGENYTVTFKKKGHETRTAQINRGVDGWYIGGNFFFGGLIGWLIIDPATGAMWTLSDLHADLSPSDAASVNKGIQIVTIDQIPEHLHPKMEKIGKTPPS